MGSTAEEKKDEETVAGPGYRMLSRDMYIQRAMKPWWEQIVEWLEKTDEEIVGEHDCRSVEFREGRADGDQYLVVV